VSVCLSVSLLLRLLCMTFFVRHCINTSSSPYFTAIPVYDDGIYEWYVVYDGILYTNILIKYVFVALFIIGY
jgi:hypothetical protein